MRVKAIAVMVVGALVLCGCGKEEPGEKPPAQETTPEKLPVPEGLFPIVEDGKFGFVDGTGAVVVEPTYEKAGRFRDGLAVVKVEGKFGYIDESGEIAIEPMFIAAQGFSGGLAVVATEQKVVRPYRHYKMGLIDTSGKFVREPEYDWNCRGFSGGLAYCSSGNRKEGFEKFCIDTSGEVAFDLPDSVVTMKPFADGRALVSCTIDGEQQFGYLDTEGKFAIGPQKLDGYPGVFGEGLAAWPFPEVEKSFERWGYIDPEGETAIEPRFHIARPFSEGMAAVTVRGSGRYIDKTGKIVIELKGGMGGPFRCGLAAVKLKGKYGYMDKKGEEAIAARFDKAHDFEGGLARVVLDAAPAYINKAGEVVWHGKKGEEWPREFRQR